MEIRSAKTIYNTNIPLEIIEGRLVEGQFDINSNGLIVSGAKGGILKWFKKDTPDPVQLGHLLAKLPEGHPNIRYFEDRAIMPVNKEKLTQSVRDTFKNVFPDKEEKAE